MAVYQSTHTGSQIDSGVTKGLLVPTPSSVSDAGKVIAVNQSGNGYELQTQSGGMSNPMTTQGDIIIGGASGTPTRLAKGTSGQTLKSDGSSLQWVDGITYSFTYTFDIEDIEYRAEEPGQTWNEWVSGAYNFNNFMISNNKVVPSNGVGYVAVLQEFGESYVAVDPTDNISGGESYYIVI